MGPGALNVKFLKVFITRFEWIFFCNARLRLLGIRSQLLGEQLFWTIVKHNRYAPEEHKYQICTITHTLIHDNWELDEKYNI